MVLVLVLMLRYRASWLSPSGVAGSRSAMQHRAHVPGVRTDPPPRGADSKLTLAVRTPTHTDRQARKLALRARRGETTSHLL